MFRPLTRSTATLLLAWVCGGHVFAVEPDTFSKVVSFQYESSLDEPGTTIQSKVVSFQYFDKLDDADLTFATSANVSFRYDGGEPVIVNGPVDHVVPAGTNLTLSVAATGDAPLSYQWFFNGSLMPGRTASALSLNNAQPTQTGLYSVVVTNSVQSIESGAARVDVFEQTMTPKPAQPALSTTTAGSTPPLVLAAMTAPPLNVGTLYVFDRVLNDFSPTAAPATGKPSVVLSHGWRSKRGDWPLRMASALAAKNYDVNILAWDWEANAKLNLIDPAPSAFRTPDEGRGLGLALLGKLGASYSLRIHFIGHSLGTMVNCAAADFLHGDAYVQPAKSPGAYPPSNSHMTLFDEAGLVTTVKGVRVFADLISPLSNGFLDSQPRSVGSTLENLSNLWSKVIPTRHGFVDNYISEVGLLHKEAVNVMLFREALLDNPIAAHGEAYDWYIDTVNNPSLSIGGHAWSYENQRSPALPAAHSYYYQDFQINGSRYGLVAMSPLDAWALRGQHFAVFPTLKAAQLLGMAGGAVTQAGGAVFQAGTTVGTWVQAGYMNAVQHTGAAVADYVLSYSGPAGQPVFTNTAGSTAAYFSTVPPAASNPQSNWMNSLSVQRTTVPLAPFQASKSLFSESASQAGDAPDGNDPIFIMIPTHVPNEAVGLTFEYQITGAAEDDFMTACVGETTLLTMEAGYVLDAAWNSTPVLQVSDLRNQDVQMIFTLNGAGAPSDGVLSIRNIQFYIPPRPELGIQKADAEMTLSWPLHGLDWTLESTTDLTQPNSWQPVLNPEVVQDYVRRVNVPPTATAQFFRLRK